MCLFIDVCLLIVSRKDFLKLLASYSSTALFSLSMQLKSECVIALNRVFRVRMFTMLSIVASLIVCVYMQVELNVGTYIMITTDF